MKPVDEYERIQNHFYLLGFTNLIKPKKQKKVIKLLLLFFVFQLSANCISFIDYGVGDNFARLVNGVDDLHFFSNFNFYLMGCTC